MRPALLTRSLPTWLPRAAGVPATIYADFTNGHYWYAGQQQGSATSWLTTLGGTFSRASSATYTNSSGLIASAGSNLLRFDYGVTPAPRLWLEGSTTNLAEQSSAFATSPWAPISGFISATNNAGTAPDGTSTATQITITTGGNQNSTSFQQTVSMAASQTHTVSCWARTTSGTYAFALNCTQVSVANHFSTNLTATTTWQRFTFTQAFGAGGSGTAHIGIGAASTVSAGSFLAWGFQAEANTAFASSSISTTSSTVARAADALAFSWTPPAAFTQFVKITTPIRFSITQNMVAWAADSGGTSNSYQVLYNKSTGHLNLVAVAGGSTVATLDLGAAAANTTYGIAFAVQSGSIRASINGGSIVSATPASLPSGITTERYGAAQSGLQWFGHVVKTATWGSLFANDNTLISLAAS